MDKLTREEVAKVFAMYGQSSFIEGHGNVSGSGPAWHVVYKYVEDENNDLLPYKLLLKQLSEISDEDLLSVIKLEQTGIRWSEYTIEAKTDTMFMFRFRYDNSWRIFEVHYKDICYTTFQYLISKSYAVPLFFAPNHWANGKTAIDLGLALPHTNN